MQIDSSRTLTPAEAAEYSNSGFVIKRGLFDGQEMAEYKLVVERIVRERNDEVASGVPVFLLPDVPKELLDFCTRPELVENIRTLVGPRIEFLSVKPVYKDASVIYPSSWHQDYAFWKGSNKISVWIALDDATVENGCLRFMPGLHRSFIEHSRKDGPFGNYLPDDQLDVEKAIDAPMAAGDACFFIDLAPHASYGNVSGGDRWSMIPTYRNADEPDSSAVWSESIVLE
jgi:hypothetical protein